MRAIAAALLVLSLAACATPGTHRTAGSLELLVDKKDVDPVQYTVDATECNEYANRVAGPGTGALAGAAVAGVVGYALGRAMGVDDPSAIGRTGVVAGGVGGAAGAYSQQLNVVRNCLTGRGYKVLN